MTFPSSTFDPQGFEHDVIVVYPDSMRRSAADVSQIVGYVLEAMLLAVVFIYLIPASLFGSFLQPLAIMLALPLSFIGVTVALLITRDNINVLRPILTLFVVPVVYGWLTSGTDDQ